MSPIFSISEKGSGAGQAIFRRHMAALEVGQREDCGADEGGRSHGKTPIGMEAGEQRGDSQAWQRRVYATESLSLHITVELHGKSGRKSSPWAAVKWGRMERTTE